MIVYRFSPLFVVICIFAWTSIWHFSFHPMIDLVLDITKTTTTTNKYTQQWTTSNNKNEKKREEHEKKNEQASISSSTLNERRQSVSCENSKIKKFMLLVSDDNWNMFSKWAATVSGDFFFAHSPRYSVLLFSVFKNVLELPRTTNTHKK